MTGTRIGGTVQQYSGFPRRGFGVWDGVVLCYLCHGVSDLAFSFLLLHVRDFYGFLSLSFTVIILLAK
uniref:Uncharacterized protein n=1 Tax=Setaria digitata TaxID=48799 RepID=A0A915Q5J4_9BILA